MKVNAKIACFSSVVPIFGPGDGIEVVPPTLPVQATVFAKELSRWIESGALEVVERDSAEPEPEPKTKAAKKKG